MNYCVYRYQFFYRLSLRWRHSGRDCVSNHQSRECLLSCLIRRRSKKTLKLRVTGLCAGNSPGTGEFPAQRASNAENVSIWWRHHDSCKFQIKCMRNDTRYQVLPNIVTSITVNLHCLRRMSNGSFRIMTEARAKDALVLLNTKLRITAVSWLVMSCNREPLLSTWLNWDCSNDN